MLDTTSRGASSPLSMNAHAAHRHAAHETLALYLLGDLSVRTAMATKEHLSSCSHCKAKLPEVRAVIAALRSAQV
jgi:anti-sigma factor RsiW